MGTFRVILKSENLDEVTEFMNDWQEAMVAHIEQEAAELGVDFGVAADIVYLRTRSRWTQEKEDELIRFAKEGKPLPDVLSGDF